jgi:hypothetical protein
MEESKRSLHAIIGEGEGEEAATKISIRTSNGSIKLEPWLGDRTGDGQDKDPVEGEIDGEFVL